jgi:glycosyltransferase involved in cell wall biosynthesis
MFLLRLVRNSLWADVIYVQISGAITAFTNGVFPSIFSGRLGKIVIIRYGGGYPETFLATYDRYFHRFFHDATVVVNTSLAANSFRIRGYKTWVIPNIAEVENFLTARREPGALRVIVCRHLDRIYNIPIALKAFKIVKQEFPSATLTVTGDGPMLEELRRLSESLSLRDVVFRASVPHSDLPGIFAKADVFINPTNAVEIPLSLVEAAAAGLVIVASDTGAIREFIQHNVNGLLSAPNDSEMMAKWVIALFHRSNLMSKFRRAARRSATQYSWSALRDRYYELCRRASRHELFRESVLESEHRRWQR